MLFGFLNIERAFILFLLRAFGTIDRALRPGNEPLHLREELFELASGGLQLVVDCPKLPKKFIALPIIEPLRNRAGTVCLVFRNRSER